MKCKGKKVMERGEAREGGRERQKKRKEKRGRRRRQRLPLQKNEQREKEEESGWSLSLKGTGYLGDRAGQYNYNS